MAKATHHTSNGTTPLCNRGQVTGRKAPEFIFVWTLNATCATCASRVCSAEVICDLVHGLGTGAALRLATEAARPCSRTGKGPVEVLKEEAAALQRRLDENDEMQARLDGAMEMIGHGVL